MKRIPLTAFRLRSVLALFFGIVLLVSGTSLGMDQELSWAAPALHPDQQTVPPRPPPPPPPGGDEDDGGGGSNPAPPTPLPVGEPNQPPPPNPTPIPDERTTSGPATPTQVFEPGDLDQLDESLLIDPIKPEAGESANRSSEQFADLNLTKSVDNPRPQEGEPVSFTIMIHNSGPANATNIAVSEQLPPGLQLESVAPGRGIFNQATGLWTISALAPGQNAILTVLASVTSGEALINTAQISAVDQFDPDSTPGNDLAGEDDQDSAGVEAFSEIADSTTAEGGLSEPDESQATSEAAPDAAAGSGRILSALGSLSWLFVLILAALLVLIGIILTKRS